MSIRNLIKQTQLRLAQGLYESRQALVDQDLHELRPIQIVQLEERILMSASPLAVVADAADSAAGLVDSAETPAAFDSQALTGQQLLDIVADDVLPANSSQQSAEEIAGDSDVTQQTLELVFIDGSISNLDQMIADLTSENDLDQTRSLEIVVLDTQRDGIAQITAALIQYNGIDGIHIVSHGTEGQVQLGSTTLSLDNLDRYRSAISAWQHSMSEEADILIYGCNVAESEAGQQLLNQLSELTATDVAGSEDLTGHTDLGGDWDLEYQTGFVSTANAFSDEFIGAYYATLDITGNLVGHYQFEENGGGTLTDSAGNQNGTFGNAASWTADQAVGTYALDFTGDATNANAYVDVADNAAQDFGSGNFTVGFWYNSTQTPSGDVQLIGDHDGSRGFNFYANGGSLTYQFSGSGGSLNNSTTFLNDGQWHHVALTYDGSSVVRYVNGVSDLTVSASFGDLNTSNSLKFGASSATSADYEGLLDDVRIYQRALNSADIGELYALNIQNILVDTTADVLDGNTTDITTLLANRGADGFISLREAIIASNNTAGADTIVLGANVYDLTRTGSNESFAATGDLDIRSDITIIGAGAGQTTISASGLGDRFFDIEPAGDLTLNSLTLADANSSHTGGAIKNSGVLNAYDVVIRDNTGGASAGAIENSGDVTLERVSLYDNRASSFGGAIRQTGGTLSLTNVVVSGNSTSSHAGGVYMTGGTANVNHSTFAENMAGFNTGGFLVSGGSATISNSIFADNNGGSGFNDDISGNVTSLGYNILEAYLGFTATGNDITGSYSVAARTIDPTTRHAYYAITPADAAADAAGGTSPAMDILGATRDANPDIGATEYIPPPPDLVPTSTTDGGLSINSDGGNDAYLEADTSPFNAEGQVTVEVDFKVDTPATGLTTLLSYATGSNQDELYVGIDSGGEVFFRTSSNSGSGYGSITHAPQLLDGNRHTLAVTWNSTGGLLNFYVDGEELGIGRNSYQTGSTIDAGGTLVIGQHQTSPGGGFDANDTFEGTIYSARVFSDLRTEPEIAASYRSELPFDEADMLAQWNFDNLSSDGVVIETVSGNNLTVNHTSETGFTQSEPTLTFAVDENAIDGTVVGQVSGLDAEREAQIASLLAADTDLVYSAETGKFYKLVNTSQTWSVANSSASSELLNGIGAELVTIHSQHENAIVYSMAQGVGDVYIGATDSDVEGEFNWYADGTNTGERFWNGDSSGYTPGGAFSNFIAGEPENSPSDRDYVELDSTTGKWYVETSAAAERSVVQWNADEVLDATQALTYVIQSQTVDGAFAIDGSTGQITVADGTLLDFESNATHTVTVRVSDSEATPNTYDEAFTISLNDLVESNNAPTDLSSGIELNSDGGNDAYLVADDGGAIFGGLTEMTYETTFTAASDPDYVVLGSYAADDVVGNDFKIFMRQSGTYPGTLGLVVDGEVVRTTRSDFAFLTDGSPHTVSATWDNTNGDWSIYVDGEHIESGTGLATGASIAAGGTFLYGQEQDSNGGGFEAQEQFQGTLYDVRIWDEVRSEAEIALNYQNKYDTLSLPSGLIANWQMDGFNGSNKVVDVVSGNNLSIGHATGTGFTASTPVEDLHISENAADGASVGFVVPSDPDVSNNIVNDGLFTDAGTPTEWELYEADGTGNGATFGGWTVTHAGAFLQNANGIYMDETPLGGNGVHLGAGLGDAISQTLTTEVGKQYQVTFAGSGLWDSAGVKQIRVSANGESADFTYDAAPANWNFADSIVWEHNSLTFTATETSTALSFQDISGYLGQGTLIADVQVIEVPQAVGTLLNNNPGLTYDAATGKFYQFVNASGDFNTSLAAATGSLLNGSSGQLVTINSAYENELIRQFAVDNTTSIWLGTRDANNDGNWNWLDGTVESDEQFWTGGNGGSAAAGFYAPAFGQSESTLEDYARLDPDGTWADDTPTGNHAYVVEWDASEVLSSFTFSLTDASNNFEIDSSTGEITVAATNTLDYESAASHDVAITVTDAAGESDLKTMTIAVDNELDANQTVPGPQTIDEDSTLTFTSGTATEVSVTDSFGGTNSRMRVTLSVNDGVLNLSQTTGLTFVEGANGSSSFVIDGTESDLNAALDGMTFMPNANFNGSVTLNMNTALQADLNGRYEFEGNADDTSSGTSNNGTLVGATTAIDGTRGVVLSLDGDGDYVEIGGTFGDPTSASVGGWVNFTGSARGEFISIDDRLHLKIDEAGVGIGGSIQTAPGVWNDLSSNVFISGTGWHHVMYVFDDVNDVHTLYLDGVEIASEATTDSIDWAGATTTYIGQHPGGINEFEGRIDDARIYTRALTADEIAALASEQTEASNTVAITVDAVNDAPTFELPGEVVMVDEGVGYGQNSGSVVLSDGSMLVTPYDNSGTSVLLKLNADASIDTAFGVNGYADNTVLSNGFIQAVEEQTDGKLLVSGRISGGVFIARYNADGTVDTSFGTSGITTIGGGADEATDLIVQPDGNIVLVGEYGDDSFVTRLSSTGSLDGTFGTAGITTVNLGGTFETLESVTLLGDGSIVAVGQTSVIKLNSSGTLDTSFDSDGILNLGDSAFGVEVQADGKFVVTGGTGSALFVTRFNADGSLDTDFGTSGTATWNTSAASGHDIAQQADGKLVVAGFTDGYPTQWVAVRFNVDGSLDSSFGTGGAWVMDNSIDYSEAYSVSIYNDGTSEKIVIGGYTTRDVFGGSTHSTMIRLNSNGELDATLGTNTLDGNPTFVEGGAAVVLDADVRIFDAELSDANDFGGASLSLFRNGGSNPEDVFSASGNLVFDTGDVLRLSGTAIGSYTNSGNGALLLNFSASTTNAQVNETLQSIAYSNTSDSPPSSVQLNWTFTDGNFSSLQGSGGNGIGSGSTTVNITAVNDAPVLDDSPSTTLGNINEDSGAPVGAVGTLVSSLVDFASPLGQLDNVTDGDSGASLGIAVTAADAANGTWFYSIDNGTTWNGLGAVDASNARLLAADANTRLYFQADANFAGTVADAITFHAWDQTSGTNGAVADVSENSVADQFSTVSYSNNDGTTNWASDWIEVDADGGGATGGRILVRSGGDLEVRARPPGNNIYREVDLSGATSAILSFDYQNSLGNGDEIVVQASSNGGSSYTTLTGGTFTSALNTGSGTFSLDISSFIAADTNIRFFVVSSGDENRLYVDNIQILSPSGNSGGSTAFSSTSDTASLTVVAINDAPTIANLDGDGLIYNAGVGSQVLDQATSVVVTDIDSANFGTGSLTVSIAGGNSSEDELSIRNQGTGAGQIGFDGTNISYEGVVIGVASGGTSGTDLTVTLNSLANETSAAALMANVTFENTNAVSPTTGARTVSFVLADGNSGISEASNVNVNVVTPAVALIQDRFNSVSYGNNDGTVNWSNSWTELGESNGPNSGDVQVDNGALEIGAAGLLFAVDITGSGAQRTADLSTALSASLSIDLWKSGVGSASLALQVSTNGSTWTTLNSFAFSSLPTTRSTYDFDISAYTSATTSVRLIATGSVGGLLSSGAFYADNISINYIPNTAPLVGFGASSMTFAENQGATVIDSAASVLDAESIDFDGGDLTVNFTSGGSANDRLAIQNQGTAAGEVGISGSNVTFGGVTVGTFAGGTDGISPLIVSFNGSATPASAQAILRAVTYDNVSESPSTTNRIISAVVTDGDGGTSTIETKTISVTAVNDAPVLDNSANLTLNSQAEDTGAPVGAVGTVITDLVSTGGNVTDVDTSSQTGIAITAADTTNGTWWYTTDSGTTWNALGAVSESSARVLNAASNTRIYFQSNADYNGTITNAITFRAWDRSVGTNGSQQDAGTTGGTSAFSTASETADITITAVNDLPVTDLNGSDGAGINYSETFAEGDSPVNIADSDATITDVDNTTYNGIGINLGGFTDGSSEHVFVNGVQFQFGVSDSQTTTVGSTLFEVDSDGTGFTITRSGGGVIPQADLQALLRTVTYENISSTPTAGNRTFTIAAEDAGLGNATPASVSTISVSPVNNAPVISDVFGGQSASEGSGNAAFSSETITDVDSPDFDGGTLSFTVSSTPNAANDTLQIRNVNGVAVTGTDVYVDAVLVGTIAGQNSSGPLTVSFNSDATVARTDKVLKAFAILNLSDDPTTGTRTVDAVLTDGDGGTSNVSSKDINFTAVNDAPVLDTSGSMTLATIDEDQTTNGGDTVASIIASAGGDRITDVDSGAAEGIAIRSLVSGNGTWQYSTDGGGSWADVGTVSGTSALLLRSTDAVRFVPDSQTGTTASIDFHAWDQTSGTFGTKADVSINGGTTAFSAATRNAEITITAVNDVPTIVNLAGDVLNYTEGDGAVVVEQGGNAVVSDVDSSDFDGGTLTVSFASGSDAAEDVLAIRNQGTSAGQIGISGSDVTFGGTIIGTFTGGSSGTDLVVTFNSNATSVAVTMVVQNTTYENTDTLLPTGGSRQVEFTVTDGDGGTSVAHTAIVSVGGTNDAPVIVSGPGGGTYNENAPGTFFNNAITIADADSADLNGGVMTVTITNNADPAGTDRLTILDGANVTRVGDSVRYDFGAGPVEVGTVTAGSGIGSTALEITFNANANPTAVQAVAQRIVFNSVSEDPSGLQRTLTLQLTDGDGGTSNTATRVMNVIAINDAPVLQNGNGIGYSEGSGALAFTAASITDADSANFDGGVLTFSITSGTDGTDTLTLANFAGVSLSGTNVRVSGVTVGTISGNQTNGPLSITFNANAVLSDVQAVYRATSIQNLTDNPNAGVRVISAVLTDGDGGTSNTATANPTLTAVNDNPSNTGTLPTDATFTEDVATAIDLSGIVLADPDANSGELTLKLNAGNGTLTAAASAGITLTGNGSSALTVRGTLASLNTYLQTTTNITYLHSTPHTNGNDVDTIAVAVNDNGNTGSLGGNDVSLGSVNVDITAVNDAPTGLPVITGIVSEDQTIAADTSGISDADGLGAFGYQWTRDGVDIGGATASTYALTDADVGSVIRVEVSYTDTDGTAEGPLVSNPTAAVSNVNDVPVLVNNTLTILEDSTVVLSAANLSATDADNADSGLTFNMSGVTAGHFAFANSPQATITSFTQAQVTSGQIIFRHDNSETAPSYNISVSDGTASTAPAAASITFTNVNDAPVLSALGGDAVAIFNDGVAVGIDVNSAATLIDAETPADYAGAVLQISGSGFQAADLLSLSTTGTVTLSTGFSNGSTVSVSGTNVGTLSGVTASSATVTFNANATATSVNTLLRAVTFETTSTTLGNREVAFSFNDADGTANGGVEQSSTVTAGIFVAQAGNGLVTTDEDTTRNFVATDFDFTGITGSNLQFIEVLSLPANGTLTLSGAAISTGQIVTKAQIDSGLFRFVPDADENGVGYTSFDFRVNNGNPTVTVLAGETNTYTVGGTALPATNAILANTDNFGVSGTYSSNIAIVGQSNTINAAYLAQGDVLFNGFVVDSAWTGPELSAVDTWVQNGGVLISTSDASSYDAVSAFYGLTIGGTASTTWHVADQTSPIMNGAFGLVGTNGSAFTATGSISYFNSASLAVGDQVLAVDSVSGEPTMVLRQVGSGMILFTGDEGIFRGNMTGGGTIATANDRLVANIFAWAGDQLPSVSSATMNISVNAINDDPFNSGSLPMILNGLEDIAANIDLSSILIGDVDANTGSMTLKLNATAGDLTATAGTGITIAGNRTSALTLSGNLTDLNAYLNVATNVSYLHPTPHFFGSDSISVAINDNGNTGFGGGTDVGLGTIGVTIAAVNDAPAGVPAITGTPTEDQTLTVDTSGISDADGLGPFSYQWTRDGIAIAGATTSSYTLGDADVGTNVAIQVSYTDGHGTAETVTSAPSGIANVNDAPTLTAGNSIVYTENDAATAIDPTITIADIDNTNLQRATVEISGGLQVGADILTATIGGGINASTWTPSTGTLTLFGKATVAEYQSALRQVAFQNSSDTPSPALRTITWTVFDGTDSSVQQNSVVRVIPVNDEQVLATNLGMTVDEGSNNSPITQAVLETTDVDHTAAQVVYTINELPTAGTLRLNGTAITSLLTSLTQQDINSGLLTYDHNGVEVFTDSFSFTVDDGTGVTSSGRFNITITPVNDNTPVVTPAQTFTVSEFAPVGASVGTLTATDTDIATSFSDWAIISGNADGVFAIDQATGEVTVADRSRLNFEITPNYTLQVTVSDGTFTSAAESISIVIQDENDAPVLNPATLSVSENSDNGMIVGQITATDEDAAESLDYSITGPSGNAFSIDSVTGIITVTDSSQLNFETSTTLPLTIQVVDNGGLLDSQAITVNLIDVNETPIDITLVGGSVNENSVNGTTVATVTGVDVDAADVQSYLLLDDANGRFTIDAATGQIRVSDSVLLDFESNQAHTIVVQTTDSGSLSRQQTFSISVVDVNEAPTAIGDSYSVNQLEQLVVDSDGMLSNDFDIDGDNISVVLVNGPANGSVVVNSDGSFTYMPLDVFSGDDSFTYVVTDGALFSDVATVEIFVKTTVSGNANQPAPVTPSTPTEENEDSESSETNDPSTETTGDIDTTLEPGTGNVNRSSETSTKDADVGLGMAGESKSVEILRNTNSELFVAIFLDEVTESEGLRNDDRVARGRYDDEDLRTRSSLPDFIFQQVQTENPFVHAADFDFEQTTNFQDAVNKTFGDLIFEKVVVGSSAAVSTSVSVGYAVWMLRGGSLLTSILSSLPVWQGLDPLPVLESFEDDSDEETETLASIVAGDR